MDVTRRQITAFSTAAVAVGLLGGFPRRVFATPEATADSIAAFTGGTEPQSGKITLTAPEIAENGNTVPISVDVESPMTEEAYVASVLILAEGNPNPEVVTFNFTPMSGAATATTRIRLAQTQNVIAIAKMSDGTLYSDRKEVKVTIGGCGG